MNPSPSPSPVEVFVHSGPAEWWQILAALGPFAVLVGAVVAGIIGWRTLKQKAEADNRAEWWKRTQWALDAVYSGDTKRATVGMKVLGVLAESDLAGPGELAVLEAAWKNPLSDAQGLLGGGVVFAKAGKIAGQSGTTGRWRVSGARRVDADAEPGDNGTEGTTDESEGGRP